MNLDRNLVAKLLETKPHNIKSLKQVESKIYIQLGDSENELFMSVEEYQNCLQQLKHHEVQINPSSLIAIVAIIGTFIFATMSSFDTRLANTNPQTDIELTSTIEK